MLRTRFRPVTKTSGLELRLKPRSFAGPEPEDTVACRVLSWNFANVAYALFSPAPGKTGNSLAPFYALIANHFYLEMLARREVSAQEAVRWLQHWPARDGAPAPHDEDHFEYVQLSREAGQFRVVSRHMLKPAAALPGLQLRLAHR